MLLNISLLPEKRPRKGLNQKRKKASRALMGLSAHFYPIAEKYRILSIYEEANVDEQEPPVSQFQKPLQACVCINGHFFGIAAPL